ncbi:MAG: ABC transporter substrate-binding protein [Spirochaetales bacterium]|nr:ABC transporter substrate-binding protein [Spirochaetales bacterium]
MKKVLSVLTVLIATGLIIGCISEKKPVKIGFVSDLSKLNSTLGISARNGLELAIEELNNKNGLLGHEIELITKDHEGSDELCYNYTKQLIEEGANVIISPVISEMAFKVIDATKESNILILGPTASASDLAGMDDNFLRIVSPSSSQGVFISKLMKDKGFKKVIVIADQKNKSYVDGVVKGFVDDFSQTSSHNLEVLNYKDSNDFTPVINTLSKYQPEAIFFVTNGLDCATITQLYAKNNQLPALYGSSWVKASSVEIFGGRRVDGMIVVDAYQNPTPRDSEVEFMNNYRNKFHTEGSSVSIYFYEAMMLYSLGVNKAKSFDSIKVKKAILGMEIIEGLLDNYRLDRYGDGIRKISIFIIKDGMYETIQY